MSTTADIKHESLNVEMVLMTELLKGESGDSLTAIVTIWKETNSVKWTTLATFIPLFLAFLVTFDVYQLSLLF